MATIKSFKAIRPLPSFAKQVAALPYDVMNSDEAREMVKGNPYSFLHVDKAEIDLSPEIDIYDSQVYEKARENLNALSENNICAMDEKACLYIYRQIMNGRAQTGLVGCAAIDEYLNNTIKKHEFTRADKEADRIRHVDTCDANTGPIFLTYRAKEEITKTVSEWQNNHAPEYDFVSDDGISHTVWIIDCEKTIDYLSNAFTNIDSLYIADGHHRAASAVKVGQKRRAEHPNFDGSEEFNFFLAVYFPSDELKIMDYNRVIKDLNGYTSEEFINKISDKFIVSENADNAPFHPAVRHTFGMFLDDKWYCLTAKDGTYNDSDPVGCLDVSILQNNLIEPILGIDDPRTDKRIDFVGGIRGLEELERRVHTDMKLAFSMCPTTLDELMDIADAGKVMPPKSTWFEPKLLSGLFIHKLSD